MASGFFVGYRQAIPLPPVPDWRYLGSSSIVLPSHTVRFTRRNLPHWEVRAGRYFITVRCADSLPTEAILRLGEIHEALLNTEPQSKQCETLRRRYFITMEKYLDAGLGSCPLKEARAAATMVAEFAALTQIGITVPHFTVMPNHWHALAVFPEKDSPALGFVMKRLKGRAAKAIGASVGGSGPVWQREWFDRWMRSDAEMEKCIRYIQNNPVKAGIVPNWPNTRGHNSEERSSAVLRPANEPPQTGESAIRFWMEKRFFWGLFVSRIDLASQRLALLFTTPAHTAPVA